MTVRRLPSRKRTRAAMEAAVEEEESSVRTNKEESNTVSGLTLELITELLCHHRVSSRIQM